jgi:hypothetical protein
MNVTIVLDIDDLMCVTCTGKQDEKRNHRIVQKFPESTCWDISADFEGDVFQCLHFIPTGWFPCLRFIIQKWKWNIALFSAGSKSRNDIFASRLAKELNLEIKDIKVYSREDLTESCKEKEDEFKTLREEYCGNFKKNLVKNWI